MSDSIYAEDCPPNAEGDIDSGVRDSSMQLLGIVGRLYDGLQARIDQIHKQLADPVRRVQNQLKNRLAANEKLLGQLSDVVAGHIQTRVSETGVALNTVLSAAELAAKAAAETRPLDKITGFPVGEVVASPATPPLAPPTVELATVAAPLSSLPAAALVDSILAVLTRASTVADGGQALPEFASVASVELRRTAEDIAALALSMPQTARPAPQSPSASSATICPAPEAQGGLPPVDLDQPLAFRFSPDDAPWKQAAVDFAGPWLAEYLAAPTVADYIAIHSQRGAVPGPYADEAG